MPQPSSGSSGTSKSAAAKPAAAKPAAAKATTARTSAAKSTSAKSTAAKPAAAKRAAAAKSTSAKSAAAKPAAKRSTARASSAKPAAAKAATGKASTAKAGASKADAPARRPSRSVRIHVNTDAAQVEAIAERAAQAQREHHRGGREAGESTLASYEKALKAIATGVSKGPAKDELEWISHLAASQAKFVRDITDSWAKAARERLKYAQASVSCKRTGWRTARPVSVGQSARMDPNRKRAIRLTVALTAALLLASALIYVSFSAGRDELDRRATAATRPSPGGQYILAGTVENGSIRHAGSDD